MSRRIRFIPEGGALVEVTCRTLQSRFLLLPGDESNALIRGVLARAARLYEVGVCACVFLSNHYHLLLVVRDAQQLARFMNHLNSNLAREAGRLADWRERFWARRYQAIVVTEEEGAQVERLRYILAHGSKEGLVARPQDWPGVHCVQALLEGTPIAGLWFDRTQEYAARRRGEAFAPAKYATAEILVLEPLPCWNHLPEKLQRRRAAELVEAIEAEAAVERERVGIHPPGPAAIRAQHPHNRPVRTKRSPAPLVHAATRTARRELYEAYAWFLAAFRHAAEGLREGDVSAKFPSGSFPPGLPFVSV
jgi:REP element-mobilizing transposase RayT